MSSVSNIILPIALSLEILKYSKLKWSYLSQEIVWLCFTSLVSQTVKASAYHAGDLGLIPGSGRSSGEGNGNPLKYSCLENSMDVEAWWATVHGIAKSRTWFCNFTFTFISQSESSKLCLAYLTWFPLLIVVWPGLFVGWTSLLLWCDRRNSDVLFCFQTLPT